MSESVDQGDEPVVRSSLKGEVKLQWSTQTFPGGGYLPWRHGWGLPSRWTSIVDSNERYLIQIEMAFDGEVAPICNQWQPLNRDGSPWPGARSGRRLPELARVACIDAALVRVLPSPEGQMAFAVAGGDRCRDRAIELAESSRPQPQPYRLIAEIYDEGGVAAMIDRLGPISNSTAHEWIAECRELSLLQPSGTHAPPGTEGGATIRYWKSPEGFDLQRWLGTSNPGERPGSRSSAKP